MKWSRSITTTTALSSCVAGMVGSGWMLGPWVCAQIAGPASIITWVIAGLMMGLIAATFVRLVVMMPVAGGTVRYIQMHYGHFAGFSFSWITWFAWVAVAPIEVMALIQYSSGYIPGLMTQGTSPVLTHWGIVAAIAGMAIMSVINHWGLQAYRRCNNIIVIFKLAIPVITVILLIAVSHGWHAAVAVSGWMPGGIKSVMMALPMAGVIYSFIGFNPAIQMSAELKNPSRSVPIAIFGSLAICMVLYTAIQIAFVVALPVSSVAHGWQQLNFSGYSGPFAGLLVMVGFGVWVKAIYVDAVVSPFGTGLVQAMATSRMTIGMAENGYFPRWLLVLNRHGSPTRAIALNAVIGIAFFMPFPSWQRMVGFLSSCLVMGYAVGPMALIPAIRAHGKSVRVYDVMLSVAALTVCSLMIYWSGWSVVSKIGVVFVVGYVILGVIMCQKNNATITKATLQIRQGIWVIAYVVGMVLVSYLGSFGGQGVLPVGIDMVVIAALSAAIVALSQWLLKPADSSESTIMHSATDEYTLCAQ